MEPLVRFQEGVTVIEVVAHLVDSHRQLLQGLVGHPLRRQLADHRLHGRAHLDDRAVGGVVQLHKQLERAGQVRGGRVEQDGTAARPGLQRDDALELQQPQSLAEGTAAGLVGFEHDSLGGQQVAGAEASPQHIAHDALGDQQRGLGRAAARHRGSAAVQTCSGRRTSCAG